MKKAEIGLFCLENGVVFLERKINFFEKTNESEIFEVGSIKGQGRNGADDVVVGGNFFVKLVQICQNFGRGIDIFPKNIYNKDVSFFFGDGVPILTDILTFEKKKSSKRRENNMKRSNKILSMALALLMVIPMFAFAPLEANAASAEGHKTFSNLLDFEDAAEGVLTADYVQSKLARGFSATSTASGIQHPQLRTADNWTVAEEQKATAQTAGADTADTSDDEFTYENAVTSSTANNGVDNKNYVLRQTTPGKFPMFTLWDTTGILFDQPFEYSFDIFPRGEQVDDAEGATTGVSTGIIHFCYGEAFKSGQRMNLVGMSNGNPTNITKGDGSFGTTLGSFKLNQWTSIRIRVYPSTGRVIVWVNGKQANDSVMSGLTDLYNAGDHTSAGIAIGWNYGVKFDFDLDNISLCSIADTPDINEHIDFTDAQIEAVAATPETTRLQTLEETVAASLSNATTAYFSSYTNNADVRDKYFSLAEDGENTVLKHAVIEQGYTAGIRLKNTLLATTKHEASLRLKYVGHGTGPLNTIRYGKEGSDGTSGAFAPLVLKRSGDVMYAGTIVDMWVLLQKTDAGYEPITIEKNKWYEFKAIVDPTAQTYQVLMKVEDGDWQTLRFLKDAPKTAAWNAGVYTEAETVDTAQFSWFGASLSSVTSVWFAHGTSNAWNGQNEIYVDDVAIKSADGTAINETVDFEPDTVTIPGTPEIPANTDWWDNDTFQNANSKKASAKLTDFQVVDAPAEASTYGKVIQPKATLGAFCFNDTKDLLPSYIFDISFDMYITQAPSSNVHLLKMWAPATGTAKVEISSLVLMGNSLYTYDEVYGKNDKRFPLNYTLSNKTWYNFRLRFDLVTGTYMAYVNGRLLHVQDWLAAYPEGKFSLSDLSNIHFEIHNHWGSSVKAYHFLDNIRVETVEEAVRNVEEFVDYEIFAADFEDSDWLDKVEAGEIDNLSMNYSKASILSDAGVAGNNALLLTGTVGGAMEVDMMAMGGYHNTFSVEMAVSYGNPHGSALDLAVLSDNNLSAEKTLLSVMGDHAKEELTGTFFFNDDGNRYYLCDYTGKYYHSDNGDAEAATFTDIGIVVDTESNSYAVYINQKPAYYKAHGEADTLTRASDIPLGMVSGKKTLKSPVLSILSCSSDKLTTNKLLVDDISVASIKNGMTPMLVGYQENTVSGTSIRFLATVDTLYYEEMGFIVEAKGVTQTISTTTVFTSVTANGSEVVAKELDGRYITALVVTGIDESPVEFTVTPYAIYFGKEIRGESQVITYTE